jgi:MFS family permease
MDEYFVRKNNACLLPVFSNPYYTFLLLTPPVYHRGLVAAYCEFQAFYEASYLPTKSPLSIAWIGFSQGGAYLFASLLAGPLYDNGYLRLLLAVGTFFIVFGFMMTSLCHELWQLVLAQGLCIGIGCGMLWVPTIGVMSQWWSKRRAMANGLGSLGAVVGTCHGLDLLLLFFLR